MEQQERAIAVQCGTRIADEISAPARQGGQPTEAPGRQHAPGRAQGGDPRC